MSPPTQLNLILDHIDSAPEYLPDVTVTVDARGVFSMGSERWRITRALSEPRPDRPGSGDVQWAVCRPVGTGVAKRADPRLSRLYDDV